VGAITPLGVTTMFVDCEPPLPDDVTLPGEGATTAPGEGTTMVCGEAPGFWLCSDCVSRFRSGSGVSAHSARAVKSNNDNANGASHTSRILLPLLVMSVSLGFAG
jgi:hypothetical protein